MNIHEPSVIIPFRFRKPVVLIGNYRSTNDKVYLKQLIFETKKYFKLNKLAYKSGIIVIFLLCFSCNQSPEQPKQSVEDIPMEKTTDTTLLHTYKKENHTFQMMKITEEYGDMSWWGVVQPTKKSAAPLWFQTLQSFDTMQPELLFGSYYGFPYWSGGNYSRAMGIDILKITQDTAFLIGPVTGYEDIDSNGTKELYINVVTEIGKCNAQNRISRYEAFLQGDSLVYQEIDLY